MTGFLKIFPHAVRPEGDSPLPPLIFDRMLSDAETAVVVAAYRRWAEARGVTF